MTVTVMAMGELPDKIRQLDVHIGTDLAGGLVRDSVYGFTYAKDESEAPPIGLFMPRSRLAYQDGALFPVMDQNLPEGFLFERLRELFPKQGLTPMHLLALAGSNGIGRLGFKLPDADWHQPKPVDRSELLHSKPDDRMFEQLLDAYLSSGVGISGVQPKILVPDRATIAVPNLIVKAGSDRYPGLAANEFLCLSAARRANIKVPTFELSDDGSLLLVDRFDLRDDGAIRLGFEDIAALMGLQVRDTLSNRKYQGSYQGVARALQQVNISKSDLAEFFSQVAFSIMVRNGDAHLKNFGVLYSNGTDIRLSPMFDVVTTAIYKYERYAGGPEMEDHTMALKLFSGRHSKTYPLPEELVRFGAEVCGVARPQQALEQIAQAMVEIMRGARSDARIPQGLIGQMEGAWERGYLYAA